MHAVPYFLRGRKLHGEMKRGDNCFSLLLPRQSLLLEPINGQRKSVNSVRSYIPRGPAGGPVLSPEVKLDLLI